MLITQTLAQAPCRQGMAQRGPVVPPRSHSPPVQGVLSQRSTTPGEPREGSFCLSVEMVGESGGGAGGSPEATDPAARADTFIFSPVDLPSLSGIKFPSCQRTRAASDSRQQGVKMGRAQGRRAGSSRFQAWVQSSCTGEAGDLVCGFWCPANPGRMQSTSCCLFLTDAFLPLQVLPPQEPS